MKKWCFLYLALCCFFLLPTLGMASPVQRVVSFQSQVMEEDGQTFLRCEIGLSQAPADYSVKEGGVLRPKRLLIDFPNTDLGDFPREYPLGDTYARRAAFYEAGDHARVDVAMVAPAEEANYRVSTLPPDKQNKLPWRLVIDIYNEEEQGASAQIDGVRGHTIVIDPGHGGSDTGAVGVDGLREKDVTLLVAQRVQELLRSSGANVVMTREDDRDVYGPNATDAQELQARVDVGEAAAKAEVFLSIHCNAFAKPAANGTETFYYPKTWQDMALAQALQDGMIDHGGRRNRGIKEARFYVLHNSSLPAALVELAFITNPTEKNLLADESFQQEMALGICEGLANYFAALR